MSITITTTYRKASGFSAKIKGTIEETRDIIAYLDKYFEDKAEDDALELPESDTSQALAESAREIYPAEREGELTAEVFEGAFVFNDEFDEPLHVTLESVGNRDFNQYDPISPAINSFVKNLAEAVDECRKYIGEYDLGGGNWAGGQVFNSRGEQIANISYNGRVWAMDGSEILIAQAAQKQIA